MSRTGNGAAVLWVCQRMCSIDLYENASDGTYKMRYAPPGMEDFARMLPAHPANGAGDNFESRGQHFEVISLVRFDVDQAQFHIGLNEDSADHKSIHKNTKVAVLGKLNQNCFSRAGRIIEVGYRWYFDNHPEQKPSSPFVQWTSEDLAKYARACSRTARLGSSLLTVNVGKYQATQPHFAA